MARDNFLKEAIADARAVREMAIANARISLEESFKPHFSSLMSQKLRNEVEGGDSKLDSSGIGVGLTVDDPSEKSPSKGSSSSSKITNPKQEVEPMGEGHGFGDDDIDVDLNGDGDMDLGMELGGDAAGAEVEIDPTAGIGGPEIDIDLGGDEALGDIGAMGDVPPSHDAGADLGIPGDEEGEEALDLEAIIRELEADVSGLDGEPEMPELEEDFTRANDGARTDGALSRAQMKESAHDSPSAPGIRGRTIVKPGQSVTTKPKELTSVEGVPGGKKVSAGQAVTEAEEFTLDEILREMEAEAGAEVSEEIATENVELKRNLREHREVIQYLKTKLQEVNMLNAKLLFTNKLFKSFDLTVGQKMKIVETFDRATNVREVKLIYSTLAESVGGRASKTGKKPAKTITEGLASKPHASTKSKTAQVISEGKEDVLRSRMMKLAGIPKQL